MKRLIALALGLLCLAYSQAQNKDYVSYIQRYSDVAVSEMYRSGIPASITLAQGLLESGAGRSQLAVKSNNHFGIKCHNGWQGGRVYHDDDAKGECFRKYDKAEDSYRDHSDFLRYRDRYQFLFEYEITDYKAWAYGLKKAGYATDPAYSRKLIGIIEQYKLYEYDSVPVPSAPAAEELSGRTKKEVPVQLPVPPSRIDQVRRMDVRESETFHFSLSRELYSKNGVPFLYMVEGETLKDIAQSNHLFLSEILKFNDLKGNVELKPGTVVYLQKKKKYAAKGLEKHVIEKGETLRGISQKYGVRVRSLCRLNRISNPDVIREGDIIRLRK